MIEQEEAFKNINIPEDCPDECDYLDMSECNCTNYLECPIIEDMK